MSDLPDNQFLLNHGQLLLDSFSRQTGSPLVYQDSGAPLTANQLFDAPYAIVSHGTEYIPIFNYGNNAALKLFEMTWGNFVRLPSSKSAETVSQEERDRLLAEVSQQGFIDNYQGIRISSTGKRFKIDKAVVWNITDTNNSYCGQAAILYHWQFL